MSERPEIYETNAASSENENPTAARPRAYVVKFKNAWEEIAYIVLAPDAWIAISAAERALTAAHNASEYPYRMVFAREIEGTVVRAPGLHILDASEVGA